MSSLDIEFNDATQIILHERELKVYGYHNVVECVVKISIDLSTFFTRNVYFDRPRLASISS